MKYDSAHESENNAFAAGFDTAQKIYFSMPWYKRLFKYELGVVYLKPLGTKSTVLWKKYR